MKRMFYVQMYRPDKQVYDVHHAMFFSDIKGKILDVGCSTGNFLVHCSKESFGVDADQESIKVAKSRGLNAIKCDLDKDKLPFKNNTFNAVNYISVIEHLRNPFLSLVEIRRVLKPNGKIALRTKNVRYWKFKFWDNFNNYSPFTKKSLEQILIDAGFKNFEIKYIRRGMFGARKLFKLGVKPSIIKRMMFFFGFFKREYLLVELKNNK